MESNEIIERLDSSTEVCDFSQVLTQHGVNWKKDGHYFLAGVEPAYNDQVIHISSVQSQIENLLEIIVPYLVAQQLSFHIPNDLQTTKWILGGLFGYSNLGKVIMIYSPEGKDSSAVITDLVKLTASFNGPDIPGCKYLGGCIYQQQFTAEGALVNHQKKHTFTLHQKYIILSTLKEDAKGDVFKGLYFKGFLKLGHCVIKEGRKGMVSDLAGRDMKDRLEWQQKIHHDLAKFIHVPKIIDLFEERRNSYLAMEFVKGKTLQSVIDEIYDGRSWQQLSIKERNKLLDLLLEVISIVEIIHEKGYVHRDLSHVNFLVTAKEELYLIDWELAYSTKLQYPLPAFKLGTAGFMSPEQQQGLKPAEQEDIYALGALMTAFFTNMPPTKFDPQDTAYYKKVIFYFTKNLNIMEMISRCLSVQPENRPQLKEIKNLIISLKSYQMSLPGDDIVIKFPALPTTSEIDLLINAAFEGLKIEELTQNAGLFTCIGQFDFRTGHRSVNGETSGIMSPIAAILYLSHKALTRERQSNIINFLKTYLKEYPSFFLAANDHVLPGLFWGLAGKALCIHYGVATGILPDDHEYKDKIKDCFKTTASGLGLNDGVAGQALAALLIYTNSPAVFFRAQLISYIQILLGSQNDDGSWLVKGNVPKAKTILKGLEHGVAGILLVLIRYDEHFPEKETKAVIERGLQWLEKSFCIDDDESLISGSAGIALTLLYGYEHFKKESYKNLAETILRLLNEYAVNFNYSLATGISGLGLVYSEAGRITSNEEWNKRAAGIYHLLENTGQKRENNQMIWRIGGLSEYDAGLLTGTGGIILFLLKLRQHVHSGEIKKHLLSEEELNENI